MPTNCRSSCGAAACERYTTAHTAGPISRSWTRAYRNLVEDGTRVMLRLKALFRARAIRTTGGGVYQPKGRAAWVAQLPEHGARLRAETLYAQLDVLRTQRRKTKAAMVAEAKRDPAFGVLETIPYFGPVRIALLLATIGTPWRFRTKRNLWAYAGLAVVTRSSSDYELFRRTSSPAAPPSAYARAEPQPQSRAQECL